MVSSLAAAGSTGNSAGWLRGNRVGAEAFGAARRRHSTRKHGDRGLECAQAVPRAPRASVARRRRRRLGCAGKLPFAPADRARVLVVQPRVDAHDVEVVRALRSVAG
eukprot:5551533-Prymnesium_polylepis.1